MQMRAFLQGVQVIEAGPETREKLRERNDYNTDFGMIRRFSWSEWQ